MTWVHFRALRQQSVDLLGNRSVQIVPPSQFAEQCHRVIAGVRGSEARRQIDQEAALFVITQIGAGPNSLTEPPEIRERSQGRSGERIGERFRRRKALKDSRQAKSSRLARRAVVDELNLRQLRWQKTCGDSFGNEDRQDRFAEVSRVAVFALAGGGVQRLRVEDEDEQVAFADRRQDAIPPRLASAEFLVEPDRMAQFFEIADEEFRDRLAAAVVADDDSGHAAPECDDAEADYTTKSVASRNKPKHGANALRFAALSQSCLRTEACWRGRWN